MLRKNRVLIDLDALKNNYRLVKEHTPQTVDVMCVIKADGYGHGMVETARALAAAGARHFAVAIAEEGVQLRGRDRRRDSCFGRGNAAGCGGIHQAFAFANGFHAGDGPSHRKGSSAPEQCGAGSHQAGYRHEPHRPSHARGSRRACRGPGRVPSRDCGRYLYAYGGCG